LADKIAIAAMLIICPSCATSYMVDPGSLGPAGRMVRCARCKTAWFAGGPQAQTEAAAFAEDVIAEAEGRPIAPRPPHAEAIVTAPPAASDDFAVDDATPASQSPQALDDEPPPPVATDAPPLAPPLEHAPPPRYTNIDIDDAESFAARRERMQVKRKAKRRSSKWTAIILALFGFNVALVGARNEVVRYVPQTASLFAAVGLPVNLRHLTFEGVKVSKEDNDGVNVLVVEGNIISAANKAVEVPRMRFAVRNTAGQEIYSWTAQPTRSILGPGETLPFRSRLASPPAEANDVVVRFFTQRDVAP
jgi:predicted Zn finger-like uncharacterized protein